MDDKDEYFEKCWIDGGFSEEVWTKRSTARTFYNKCYEHFAKPLKKENGILRKQILYKDMIIEVILTVGMKTIIEEEDL